MSRFFIYRPIFATVISIVIMLAGAIAQSSLPIAKFPQITPPTVQVTANFPGANPGVVSETVAAPIEQEVNGVENMIYMSSTCTDNGAYTLNVTFETGTDMDMATVLVQNRVSIAQPRLPEEVRRQGITTKKQSTQIVQFITLTSSDSRHDSLFLSNYATINLRDQLGRVEGVGSLSIFGADDYSMRIWLAPEKLKARNLTPQDVIAAVQEQNVQVAAGRVGEPPTSDDTAFQFVVNTKGRLSEPEEFEELILKTTADGALTRLRDVATVELGARTYNYTASTNGQPCAAIAIYQLPTANALDLASSIRREMERMSKRFPEGVSYQIPFDTTRFVEASIAEVYSTLFVAVALVVLVIFIFLQDWRATIVPSAAIPVALIGTFAVMAGLGFSINMLTLFGIVLAIGIVVDDAIVVVENAYRHLDAGLGPKEAAVKAMEEITGPVIATTLVLLAVFVPTAFMGGIVGRLYQQFSLTISAAVIISTINALTLSPALCGIFLRPARESFESNSFLPAGFVGVLVGGTVWWLTHAALGWQAAAGLAVVGVAVGWLLSPLVNRLLKIFFVGFNRAFDVSTSGYSAAVKFGVHNIVLSMAIFTCLLVVTAWGFRQVPTGFLPTEDQGYAFANIQLPDAASLGRTHHVMAKVDEILKRTDGVSDWVSISGYSILSGTVGSNNGFVAIVFEPWEERTSSELSQDEIMGRIRADLRKIQDAECIAFVPPPIDGLGNASGFQMQLQDVGGIGLLNMQSLVEEVVVDGNAQSGLTGMNSTFRASVPQVYAEIDRTKAKKLGVSLGSLFGTLQAYMGSAYINDFNRFGRTWQVRAQAEPSARVLPEDLLRVDVRNADGEMVPAGTLMEISTIVGPQVIQRYNLYPSAQINGTPAPGFSSGEAMELLEQMAAEKFPPSVTFEWTGMSYQEKLLSEADSPLQSPAFILVLSIVLVFLVLAAQYESWTSPMAVIAVVPLAALGVVILLVLRNADINIYTQIGLVLLVALASKNAILIVEFAAEQRRDGLSIQEAASKAASLRFRAILMTAFSSVLGFLPLLIAQGAGAASRQAVGNAVVGGMIAATIFALLFVPSFFVVFRSLGELGQKEPPPSSE
ncbi:multidrug efflux RND transporter permease subunit [Blastopirellula sp. JC732]|uniref:Multidrug efflux RND transporter permease subunit n=1 Tax=Blastopirellula sediminis TaxID=2894196 RepID=A0A9X1MK87_9BACT|nr:multidrug efflux RND transporter permease subunit [Blastopirellula sediminis]MCC9609423.1 multidrug efflux RND transporter permease subunit [Blastopirellula sediminis]MCC9627800.1 multidrug efflux RND transporter permease subunit [Blastopirellula sediminis]